MMKRLWPVFAVGGLLFGAVHSLAQSPAFWSWASKPVMGWNSWDFYGTTVTETQTVAQADYMAANLLSHGWNLITVDIQWYAPDPAGAALANGQDTYQGYYTANSNLIMDAYGRLQPATTRFPSATNGMGFTALANYVHSKGLKFGIHIMRGIPRQAVYDNLPVYGTTNTVHAQDIADTSSTCPWNPDMYGVDMTKPGAQAYYDSIVSMYAQWGVDFIKCDDLSYPYHEPEIEALRKAIDKVYAATGHEIVLSTSPGATPVGAGENIMQNANQWRISNDFWDNWNALYEQFQRLDDWTPYRGPGHFPDADMLPLGKVDAYPSNPAGRSTYFTQNEQYTMMSLWAIARSPLILGADLTQMDPFTLSLLTNDEVIAVNQSSLHNRQLFNANNLIAWTADAEGSTNKYLAVFNATTNLANVPVNLFSMGFTNSCAIRSLWNQTDLGSFSGTFSPSVPAHGAALYRLSGPAMPVPWITNAVAGNGQVTISWAPIGSASSYTVKRSTAETGPYQTIASGVTGASYTDTNVQNGATYFYVVTALVGGQPSPDSEVRSATPAGPPGIVSWNYDYYGTVPGGTNMAGVMLASNWNNSWPNNPTVNLVGNTGSPTTVDIVYNFHNNWSVLYQTHPGQDADGSYNKELLNGYMDAGDGGIPTGSEVSITQIPFSYYDLYVYFSSDTAGRQGTISDGSTTYSFSTIGSSSVSGANAVFTQTTDTGTSYPSANYAVFSGLSGSSKLIKSHIPQNGGIAGFQIVPRTDPLPTTSLAILPASAGTNVTLSWPAGLGSVVLQKSTNLVTWEAVDPQPTTNSIEVGTLPAACFFRLTRP